MAEQDINRKIHLINGTTRENMSCEKTQADMKKDHEAGYCSLCGSFWGGIESFDFNNPQKLCENCLDQLKSELGEYEIEEAEYNGVYY